MRRLTACAGLALSLAFVLALLPGAPDAAEQGEVSLSRAAALAQARTLERLQTSAEEVVETLERLQRQRDLPDELANLAELEKALQADNRILISALDRAFARGMADLPELENAARRHLVLTERLGQQVGGALRLTLESRDLADFGPALRRHLKRLRDTAGSRERIAALEREAARVEADRRTLTGEIARSAGALRESLRELSASTCDLHRRFEVAPSDACRAARIAEPRATAARREAERRPAMAAPGPVRRHILHSVYSHFDEKTQEPPGYGLYTYVLFPVPRPQNEAFIAALSASTDVASEERTADRRQLNLFSLPVQDAARTPRVISDPARFASREVYDYPTARDFLFRLCRNPQAGHLAVCTGGAWEGPYLLTHPRPQSQLETLELPYLFVDLSAVRERAYGEFIRAVKEQVKRPDFTDRERIDTFRLRLLNITLSAADWVEPISDGLAGIISVAAR